MLIDHIRRLSERLASLPGELRRHASNACQLAYDVATYDPDAAWREAQEVRDARGRYLDGWRNGYGAGVADGKRAERIDGLAHAASLLRDYARELEDICDDTLLSEVPRRVQNTAADMRVLALAFERGDHHQEREGAQERED